MEEGLRQAIASEVPLSEMFGYATTVRSMSQGRRLSRWNSPNTLKCRQALQTGS